MSDVNAIINIDINSSSALVNLKRLESQIDQFNRSIVSSNATAAAAQQSLNKALLDGINNTKLFNSKITPVESSMMRFSRSIDEGRLSLSEYARSAGSQLPGLGRVFRREFDNIEQVATSRVRSMQTQYLALGKTVDGVTKAIASTPTGLAKGLATDLAMTQQRQQIFNKLLDDGSTKLLNWGKNTQWAGRQLMVGFSLPLAAFGAAAAKTFMEIDKATISLKRVYGDLSTTKAELDSNVESVKSLGKEYTKYGITLSDTISLSARAAATGATNEGLMAATEQTLRFATLGQMDYNQALDTTISLQTAFAISNEDLGKTVDYLNAVENQTILTMEDMSLAIPRVATVVKGLGGSVEDLAIMMTAMREGGVSAENAANGLKSGLASLINPTNRASESLNKMGVNLNSIITQNKGDLMGIITEFGTAINKLDEFSRQQVLEQVFGKYQYARMSALFTNITKDAGQAARAMDIAGMSATDLAKISEKELGQVSDSTSVKFQAAMEQLKISIAPIGEAFLKGITPVVNMVSKIADAFNNLPDGVKNSIAVITAVVAGLGPVFLMTIGLLGNGLANLIKGFQFVRKTLAGIKGDASAFTWLAQGELEAVTASKALENGTTTLTDKLLLQRGAVSSLTAEYQRFASAAGLAGASMGRMGGPQPAPTGRGGRPLPTPRKFATGGIVPGTGNGDTIPALLTPGESVITKKATQKYAPILQQMNDGTLPGFAGGVTGIGRFLGRRTQFAHATGGRSLGGDEALRLLRPAERQLFQAPGSQSVNATALSGLTIGVSDLENQALRVGVGKGLNPKEFSQRILDEALTPDLFKKLSLPKGTRTDFRKTLSEEIEKIKKDPMFDDDLAKAFTRAEKRMVVKLKDKKELRDEFTSSIASSRQDAFTRLKFNIPENAPRVANVAEARTEAAKSGLPTPTEPFYYYHAGQRKASALVRMPDGRIVGVQTDATRKVNPIQLSGGRVSIGQALKSWQTSSRSVREDPEMLSALMSGMRPAQSARTLTRGTTLGLSRGSEFDPSDERMIMDALRSGNVDSLIGRTFPMRGPISYTAGNSDSAINAMRQNSDVNRIEELKRQHAQAKIKHKADLEKIKKLKEKISLGTAGPATMSMYEAQLAELESFVSMYSAGQKRRGKEIKNLTSRGYEDLLIEQSFPSGSSMIDVNEINPNGTFMGKDVSKENEFLSGGSIVRIKGVKVDPKTGLQTLELETISDNVQKRALGGPIVPGSGSGDTVPAMLTPGEFVVNKQATQSNLGLLHAINSGQSVNKNKGGMIDGVQYLAEGGGVQSDRGSASGSGAYKAETRRIMDVGWDSLQTERLILEAMLDNNEITQSQYDAFKQGETSHITPEVGPNGGKMWRPSNMMADLGLINNYIEAQKGTSKKALGNAKLFDEIQSKTSLSAERLRAELDLLSRGFHATTRESAMALRALSQVGDQTAQKIAVNRVLEARLQGTFYDTLDAPERQYRSDLPTEEKFGKRGKGGRRIPEPETRDPRRPPKVSPQEADRIRRQARTEAERSLIAERGVPMTPNSDYEEEIEKRAKEIRTREYERRNKEHGKEQARIIARSRQSEMQQSTSEMDMNVPSLEENKGDRRRSIGRGLQMGGGAMMMASMAPMMMADQGGNVMGMNAGAVTGGLMGAGILAEFAPILMKLPPQVLIATAAVAAVGGAFYAWRKTVDDAAKKTAELGANMGGTSNALNNMATMLGTSTPAQRQAQMQLGFTGEQQQQAASQFQPIFESETGQKFIKDLESATSADRFKKLSDYLKSAIASGMMDKQSANLFAKTIASSLSDPVLGQSIIKSISSQKTGGSAMLELAQKRESGVAAGGQLKVLGANQTVEEGTASSVIGSSIQLIQDFSNASALAKEELVAGTISYSRYKEIIDQSTSAQEKYTSAIENSFKKTEDFGATMQAWKDQLVTAGFSEEVIGKIEQATTMTPMGRSVIGAGVTGEGAKALAAGIKGQIKTRELNITSEQLRASATAAMISGMNPAQVAAIAEEVKKGGATAETFARTKDFGITGLQYNIQQGAIPELAVSNELRLRSQAVAAPKAAAAAKQEIQRREQGQQAYVSAAEKFKGAGFAATDLQQVMSMVGSPNVIDLSFQLSGMSDTEIKDTVISTQRLNELIGPEGSTKIMDILVNENPPNIDKRLPEITASIKDLMKIPDDVQKKLGIDTTSVGDVDKWGPMADEIANLSTILNTMPEGVRGIGIDLMLDANGKPLSPEEYGKASRKIIKAYKDLASGDSEIKKKAIITLMQETKDATGKTLSLEESQQAYGDLIDTYGKGKITKLPPDIITKVIDLRVDIKGLDAAIESLDGIIASGMGGNEERRAREKLMQLRGQAIASEATSVEEGLNLVQEGTKGGGGGGAKANPLLDLKKSILEQIKMYVDINATMKKLNDQRYKFADLISGKGGVLGKLRGLKGKAGGLSDSVIDVISSMGPEAAKKWIKKNTKDGKLTKEGQSQADLIFAGQARGTIEGNLSEFRGARAQRKAYKNLRGRKLDSSVVEAIAGDPEKAKQLEIFQNRVNAGIKGSVKDMNAFINSQVKAVKEAELLARAQDPIQTQIDDMTLAHKFTSAEIDKQIKIYEDQVDVINKEISAIQELNNKDQNRIRDLDRQKEIINRQIEALSRSNELDQQRADTLKRQDEIRNRTADAISHDLDIMSKKESEIQKAYDKRIKALDEVAKINDYILNQQRSQLGLADALSRGDISAAAGIQQEMQAGSAQFATQEMRTGLQTGMENQIAGLTTSGGLTRDQAEAQIASIKEQSYQTSLLIRDIEDAIYNRNLEMIPLRNSQLVIDQQIQVIQDAMYDRESAIIVIQDGKLATAQKQLDKELEIKKALDDRFNAEVLELELKSDQVKMTDIQSAAVNKLAKQYRGVAEQIKNINDLAAKATGNLVEPVAGATETTTDFAKRKKYFDDEKVRLEKERISAIASVTSAIANNPAQIASAAGPAKKINYSMGVPIPFAAGGIAGTGGRDSIPSMLTPGEFVMRKASVQKYGTAMLEKMNMGSFDMPRYSVQEAGGSSPVISTSNNTSINAPVYNTYSVNVNVPNTNADPSMIADKVIMRIGQIDNANIRSLRGNK